MHIVITPFEPLQADAKTTRVQAEVPIYLGPPSVEVRIVPAVPSPPEAYNVRRRQWDAARLIRWIVDHHRDRTALNVALHPGDLYVPGFNFVFGLAEPACETCIIGLARLQSSDPERWHHRVLTEVLHEIGHLMGLEHCATPSCVMFFSNTIRETDAKGPAFCPKCQHLVRAYRQGRPPSRRP
ncbi:MAG: archaemetzincin family Zn-dependent metalloprotease [Acidobacteria bacterium]|nr:archaemetzincin family Zn-dependent metalloprotease [Acidobacteriota bacterium]MDW7984374.1 archaemetzincin family Zn-dependent metalloprotease [Acidobacteriota bacterium]